MKYFYWKTRHKYYAKLLHNIFELLAALSWICISNLIKQTIYFSQALYDAGVKRKGTDVKTWISIMSQRSVPHLQKGCEPMNPLEPIVPSYNTIECSGINVRLCFFSQCLRDTRATAHMTCRRAFARRWKETWRSLSLRWVRLV